MSDPKSTEKSAQIDPETGFVLEGKSPSAPDDASLVQIRDLLVGPLTRNIEDRVSNLEQRLERTVLALGEKTAGAMDDLHATLSNDVNEVKERVEAMGQAQKTNVEDNEKHRAEFAEQVTTIRGELEKFSNELSGSLTREAAALRGELVDRFSLATALSELSMRLSESAEVLVDPSEAEAELDDVLGGMTK